MTSRDADICQRYERGEQPSAICKLFQITPERVRQIVRLSGRTMRPVGTPRVRSDRTMFLGVEVSKVVKTALRKEAQRRGISMSLLTAETVREMLVECGYGEVEGG